MRAGPGLSVDLCPVGDGGATTSESSQHGPGELGVGPSTKIGDIHTD